MIATRNWHGVCAAALAAWGTQALASPADVYGPTPRSTATAGAQTAGAEDGSAAIYNPAGLAFGGQEGKSSFSIGYLAGMPMLSIDRAKSDAPTLKKFPTQVPAWQGWTTISGLYPLGGRINNRATFGFSIMMPQDKVARVESMDPKLPQFMRFQNATDRLVLDVGLGIKLHEKASIGLGVDVLAGFGGVVDFNIELFEKRVDRRSVSFALTPSPALVAGITIAPWDGFRMAASYRMANSLTLSQPNSIGLGDIGTLNLDVTAALHYTPHQIALGLSWEPKPEIRLLVDVKIQLWQFAPWPAVGVKVGLGGEIPSQLGLDKALGFTTDDPNSPAETKFSNTVSPSLAFEYTFPDKVTRLRGGYQLRPTYVPDMTQPYANYLDCTAHILGFGATFALNDPTEIFPLPLKLDLAGQAQVMQPREAKKTQPNDPVGNLTAGGVVLGASASFRYEW